jgi:hypothetical protein
MMNFKILIRNLAYIWYHGGYVRITVTHCNFTETTECSFWKITVDHRDSSISTMIPKIYLHCWFLEECRNQQTQNLCQW